LLIVPFQRREALAVPGFAVNGAAMLAASLSLMMLAAIALIGGALVLWRRGERKRPALMALLVVVLLVNVAIWTVPDASGEAPLAQSVG
jgi:hypothetical protein